MTLLQIMTATGPGAVRVRTEDRDVIRGEPLEIGARYARWHGARFVPDSIAARFPTLDELLAPSSAVRPHPADLRRPLRSEAQTTCATLGDSRCYGIQCTAQQ